MFTAIDKPVDHRTNSERFRDDERERADCERFQERQARNVEINAFGEFSYAKCPELYPYYTPKKTPVNHYCSTCGCRVISNPPIPDNDTSDHTCIACWTKTHTREPMSLEMRDRVERMLGHKI
jgi:hypothetical protein